MGAHIVDGEFQSDKYPTCPPGKVPLSVRDPMAQDLLWRYAQRRRVVDAEFSDDLEYALRASGYFVAAKVHGPGFDPDKDDDEDEDDDEEEEEITGQRVPVAVDLAPISGRVTFALMLVAAGELTTRCFVALPNDGFMAHASLCLVMFTLGCILGRPLDGPSRGSPGRSPGR